MERIVRGKYCTVNSFFSQGYDEFFEYKELKTSKQVEKYKLRIDWFREYCKANKIRHPLFGFRKKKFTLKVKVDDRKKLFI